jgi:hypothetical protein
LHSNIREGYMKADPEMKEAAKNMLQKLESIPMDKVTGVSLSLMLGKPKHHKDDGGEEGALEKGIAELLESWTERDEETDAGKYYHDLKRLADSQGIESGDKEEESGDKEDEDETHNSHDEGEDY